MAEEVRQMLIEVGTGQSASTLGELAQALAKAKDNAREVAEAVREGTATQEDYQQALVGVKVATDDYNKEMRLQVKENEAAKGSYNDLVNQLARLKEQWKQAEPNSKEYRRLTEQVNEVKDKLSNMDHGIGNWQRNVGNYANSIGGLFTKVGGGIGAAAGGVQGFGVALTGLSANPVMATLGLLSQLLLKISEAFKGSEQASNLLNVAFAPLKAMTQGVAAGMEKLAMWLGGVAEKMTSFAEKMGWLNEKQKENRDLAKEEIKLRERTRELNVENAELELKISDARAKASDKENVSAAERVRLLGEARDAEAQMLANKLEIAKKEQEIAERTAALAPNDIAANDELNEKKIALLRIQKEYNEGIRRLNREYNTALKEDNVAAMATVAKNATDTAVKAAEAFQLTYEGTIFPTFDKIQKQIDGIINRTDGVIKEMDAFAAAEMSTISAELDIDTQAWLDEMDIYGERAKATNQGIVDSTLNVADAVTAIGDIIADSYSDQIAARVKAGEISEAEGEKEFEKVKAIQYSTTWLNTLAGITAALASPAMNAMGIPGWIAAASQSATLLATGIANTIKIKNTQLGSAGSSAGAASGSGGIKTSAPSVTNTLPQTRVVTNAEDEVKLNRLADRSVKAYVVGSELEGQRLKDDTRRNESSF